MKRLNGKYLSMILRHRPEVADVRIDEHGWAEVDQLIKGISRYREVDFDLLLDIVNADSKQRFSFSEDMKRIRANQGHSINVNVQMNELTPPDILYHGTGKKSVNSIMKQGILKKDRLYVHLSKDFETAVNVGRRHGKPVVFRVHSGRMHSDGYRFFLSDNGVWLVKHVPAKYIEITEK